MASFEIDQPELAKAVMVAAHGGHTEIVSPCVAERLCVFHCEQCQEIIQKAKELGTTVQVHFHDKDNDIHAISLGGGECLKSPNQTLI